MKNNKAVTQKELDAFVKEYNADPTSKCKILSIQMMSIYPKQSTNLNTKNDDAKNKTS